MSNLSGLFDDVNTQVGNIAQQVGTKPSNFEPRVFAMIEALSRNVVLPIAGVILTFIACYELIEMITQHNNMAQFEPALLMKWIFKTAISVWMISNTFDIIMAVFDVTQQVVANSSGIISGNTRVNDIGLSMLQSSMMQMDVGPLFGLFLQSFFIGITMRILSIVIFVIVYGRMIEIYMMVSLAPVPMATWGNHEQSHVGQNYLRSLFALGFQGFLILICVAIYAVLLQNVAISGDAINSIWSIVGYTVLLCFSLFKTSSVAKTLLGVISLHKQCIVIAGLVRTHLRTNKTRLKVVPQDLFGGLTVLLVHGQKKHGQHHRHHAEGSTGIASGVPQNKEQRHAYDCRCTKTDKLPGGQVEGYFGLHLAEIARHGNISCQNFTSNQCAPRMLRATEPVLNSVKHSSTVYPTMLQIELMASPEMATF